MTQRIRRATIEDAARLSELGARTFYETFVADNTEENMSAYLADAFSTEKQTAELSDTDAVVLIAESDGVATGYAIVRSGRCPVEVTGDSPIELVRLYVLQEFIGKGVGAALMQASIDQAKELGHATIWLGVWENNFRAQAFYRKWNFESVGTQVFQLGDDPQRDFVMQRSLTE